ncbi:MAG: hypothetical protein K1060chlam1_00368 [Candidatus Anoxychlamydiales bacterium]|nr:hypothetical protein [Candidatus Anoxychlamydiales bacterium]
MRNLIYIFWQIVFREIVGFRKVLVSKIIDLLIMISTNVIVFTYLMPYFGLKSNYGAFIIIGLIPAVVLFEAIPRTTNLVMDITGNKKISYILTLPMPSSMSIAAIAVGWAASSFLYTILILPIAKIFLFDKFDLSNLSIFKFLISFSSMQIMFGFFSLFLGSLIKDMRYITWIWARIVNPLFMLGGFFYSWQAIYSISHVAGIINLFNPVMLTSEAIRASILGQSGYLPFWISISALWFFILIFSIFGIMRIKKRLDCV